MPLLELAARSMGPVASRALDQPGQMIVIASFERSFYLDVAGDLIAVGCDTLHDGPLNLLVTMEPLATSFAGLGVHAGQRWSLTSGRRLQGDGLTIDANAVAIWAPRVVTHRIERGRVEAGLHVLRRLAAARHPGDGLSRLALDPDATPAGATERMAAPSLRSLRNGLAVACAGDGRPLPDAVTDLLGLGPGLTPSGDDLLAGVLIALHRIGEQQTAAGLGRVLLKVAENRTTSISLAHLGAAAEGLGAAPIHEVLDAVIAGRVDDIAEALDAASKIGHCSGWDAVGGVALALTIWLRAESGRSTAA